MKEMLPEIMQLVMTLVGMIIIMLLKKGRDYLDSKLQDDKIKSIIGKAEIALETIVKSNQEVIVNGFKKDLEDGKITKEEFIANMAQIKDKTIKQVGEFIGTEGLNVLDGFYGDSKEYLQHRIEAMVNDLKKN